MRIRQVIHPFQIDSILTPTDNVEKTTNYQPINQPSTSEVGNTTDVESLQLQAIQETYLSVIKQSLKSSFYDPSFFKRTLKFKASVLPPDTPLQKHETVKN